MSSDLREGSVRRPPLLRTAILAAIAFAGLGGFNGCTLGLANVSNRPGLTESEVVGLSIAGLLVGLALSARTPPGRGWRLWLIYGLAWFAAAGLCCATAEAIMVRHRRMAASAPIRFDRRNTVTVSFVAAMDATYDVVVDLKRRIPFEDLSAFVGGWQDPDKPKRKSPPRPEIRWTVAGATNEEHKWPWTAASYSRESIGASLGGFHATAGRRYTVTATVTKPSPTMQILAPDLQIELGGVDWTHVYVPAMVAIYGAFLAGAIGMGVFVGVAALNRHHGWAS